jgi:hypothetical protein
MRKAKRRISNRINQLAYLTAAGWCPLREHRACSARYGKFDVGELAFGFPPPDAGVAGFKFGFGGFTNLGLLFDEELDEQPIKGIVAIKKVKSSK